MKIKDILRDMLTENTGRYALDSGNYYGRHYEANQVYLSEENSRLKFSTYEADFDDPTSTAHINYLNQKIAFDECCHNIYPWLTKRLIYNEKLQEQFDAYIELPKNEDLHYLALMENFARDNYPNNDKYAINTCNSADMLSQNIQYVTFNDWQPTFYDSGTTQVILQIHNGCDVRSGYTRPKCFSLNEPFELMDNASGTILCSNPPCQTYWDTFDAGYTFSTDCEADVKDSIKDYTNKELNVDAQGNAYCPICGFKLKLNDYP